MSSFRKDFIKHIEAIELVSPPLGKPSIRVPPLRFALFIVRTSIRGDSDNGRLVVFNPKKYLSLLAGSSCLK